MWRNSKYLDFVYREKKAKTIVLEIVSKAKDRGLALIKWYGPWRQYCFFPYDGVIFNSQCLKEIKYFLVEINRLQKIHKQVTLLIGELKND